MSKKIIHLALVVSLAFIIGACTTITINPEAKGKIGDPVNASAGNVVGSYGYRGPAGGINAPTDQTLASPIGVDQSKAPAPPGKIGDPVNPSAGNVAGSYGYRGPAGGIIAPTDPTLSSPMK